MLVVVMVHGDSGGVHCFCLVAVVEVVKKGRRRCVEACVCLVHGGGSYCLERQGRKTGKSA